MFYALKIRLGSIVVSFLSKTNIVFRDKKVESNNAFIFHSFYLELAHRMDKTRMEEKALDPLASVSGMTASFPPSSRPELQAQWDQRKGQKGSTIFHHCCESD